MPPASAPLTLTAAEVNQLQSLNDPVSLDEVVAIYTNVADPERRAFDVLGWTPPR